MFMNDIYANVEEEIVTLIHQFKVMGVLMDLTKTSG